MPSTEQSDDHTGDALPSGLGAPAERALASAGLTSLTDLTTVTERSVAELHGVGPKALRILTEALAGTQRTFLIPT
ncbi:DNA-binding protein [Nakamurella silvestris]|nr:DNA-binding protein [Nakamurella silvestris]